MANSPKAVTDDVMGLEWWYQNLQHKTRFMLPSSILTPFLESILYLTNKKTKATTEYEQYTHIYCSYPVIVCWNGY
jgi:hypothetical protein